MRSIEILFQKSDHRIFRSRNFPELNGTEIGELSPLMSWLFFILEFNERTIGKEWKESIKGGNKSLWYSEVLPGRNQFFPQKTFPLIPLSLKLQVPVNSPQNPEEEIQSSIGGNTPNSGNTAGIPFLERFLLLYFVGGSDCLFCPRHFNSIFSFLVCYVSSEICTLEH